MNIRGWDSITWLWMAVGHPQSADVEQQLWLLRSSRNGKSSHLGGAALTPEGGTRPLRTVRSDVDVDSEAAGALQQQW